MKSDFNSFKPQWYYIGLIIIVTFIVFLPLMKAQFVNWDDPMNFLNNENYKSLSWRNLKWMFSTFLGGYHPFFWLFIAIIYKLGKMSPLYYHLSILLLHILTSLLLYFLLLKFLQKISLSYKKISAIQIPVMIGVLFWSIHPLRAEPVSWISAGHDVLCGVFYLLSILTYLSAQGKRKNRQTYLKFLIISIIFFIAAAFSKIMAISLPIVLLILDVRLLKRFKIYRIVVEKIPYFTIVILMSLITLLSTKSMAPLKLYGITNRVAQSIYGLTFYLWKTILPTKLLPIYEISVPFNPVALKFVLSGIFVVFLASILLKFRNSYPACLIVWIIYFVTLFPTLGIIQRSFQIVADRYSYIPSMGFSVLIALWLSTLNNKKRKKIFPLFVIVIILFGFLTMKQVKIWKDSKNLWSYTVSTEPNSATAHCMLGIEFGKEGKYEIAMKHLKQAIKLRPWFKEAYINIGHILKRKKNYKEAIRYYKKGLKIDPTLFKLYYEIGNILNNQGKLNDAIKYYKLALKYFPTFAEAYNNIGIAYIKLGEIDDAMKNFKQAIKINPNYEKPHKNLYLIEKNLIE